MSALGKAADVQRKVEGRAACGASLSNAMLEPPTGAQLNRAKGIRLQLVGDDIVFRFKRPRSVEFLDILGRSISSVCD